MSEEEPIFTAEMALDERGRITIPDDMRKTIKRPKRVKASLYYMPKVTEQDKANWRIILEPIKK